MGSYWFYIKKAFSQIRVTLHTSARTITFLNISSKWETADNSERKYTKREYWPQTVILLSSYPSRRTAIKSSLLLAAFNFVIDISNIGDFTHLQTSLTFKVQYAFLIGNDFALIRNSGQLNFGPAMAQQRVPPFPIRTAFLIRTAYSTFEMILSGRLPKFPEILKSCSAVQNDYQMYSWGQVKSPANVSLFYMNQI